jgi:pimeloyl-ACP methyl ester carboxylesterase
VVRVKPAAAAGERVRPPVLLLAGQLLTAETWAPQIGVLARDVDLRFTDHSRDDSIAGMAERALAEAPQRFDIVAHAMGGFVALEMLRRAPQRVRSLALLATLASADGPAQTERRQGYIRLVEQGRFPEVVEERIPMLLAPEHREDPALLSAVRRMALTTGAKTFLRQQRAIMGRIDSRPSLTAIACPTLIVRGDQDGITTLAQQDEMQAIPGARFVPVGRCGHMLTLEQPGVVTALLADWLAEQALHSAALGA